MTATPTLCSHGCSKFRQLGHRCRCSASVSLVLSLASASILSIPLSFNTFYYRLAVENRSIIAYHTVKQVLYCLKRGAHSSVEELPRRYSITWLATKLSYPQCFRIRNAFV